MTLLTMKGISITKSKALELGHFILTYILLLRMYVICGNVQYVVTHRNKQQRTECPSKTK